VDQHPQGVEFYYDEFYGNAVMHVIGFGYSEFGEICPDYWPEDKPPDLTGWTRFVPETTDG
jgi:hypothetical protein